MPKDTMLSNFVEKTFTNSHKTVKLSPSKVFPYTVFTDRCCVLDGRRNTKCHTNILGVWGCVCVGVCVWKCGSVEVWECEIVKKCASESVGRRFTYSRSFQLQHVLTNHKFLGRETLPSIFHWYQKWSLALCSCHIVYRGHTHFFGYAY